jgi:hypothetical protein
MEIESGKPAKLKISNGWQPQLLYPWLRRLVTTALWGGIVPSAVGKVKSARYDSTEGSGQEENDAHICARF